MTDKKEPESFYPANRREWRAWLQKNHASSKAIWLIYYKNVSDKPSVTYSEAVDEALCYGWIDSTLRSPGEGKFMQQFTKRKPSGVWSRINKEKIRKLIEQGLMDKPGLESIATAKKNGSWKLYDDVENLKIPKDLDAGFKQFPNSKKYFQNLSKSVKKQILHWLIQAKRPETRAKRINEIAELAGQQLKPVQFR